MHVIKPTSSLTIFATIAIVLGAIAIALQPTATAAIPNDISRGDFEGDCALMGGEFYENIDGSYGCDHGDWYMECTPAGCIIVCFDGIPCVDSSEGWHDRDIQANAGSNGPQRVIETQPERDPASPSPLSRRDAAPASNVVTSSSAEVAATRTPSLSTRSGAGRVLVHTMGCPRGFDAAGADLVTLYLRCQTDMGSVTFTLAEQSRANTRGRGEQQRSMGDVPVNEATFAEVQPGRITLGETVPQGYGPPIVFCDSYVPGETDTSDLSQVPVDAENRVNLRLQSEEWLFCQWFNVPENEGQRRR
jgi:hypothetical protein